MIQRFNEAFYRGKGVAKMKNKMSLIKKIWAYYKNGYALLVIKYIETHGVKKTVHKVYQVLFGKKKSTMKQIQNFVETDSVIRTGEITTHQDSIDIIVCVHNALEDVKRCLDSIVQYTNEPYHIIVVDDGSNEETKAFLKKRMSEEPFCRNARLIVNEGDLHGYAIAANIGMKNAQGEYLVLLNSDTIVSTGWLDKMMDCFQSDSNIGVVGPLSNTASWQSVPKLTEHGDWCHNELPAGMDVQDMGRLVEEYSGRVYPQVPLINGFCMMISKRVVETIGYFDEENFGRGFGEEDDFNIRAYKAGFRLAIADNVYIYHVQSKSYSDDIRKKLCEISGKILREKHGEEYIENCVTFMRENLSLLAIRERINAAIDREALLKRAVQQWKGKRILFHLPCSEAGGGANVIIQECRKLVEMGMEVAFYNLELYRESFERGYPDLEFPVYYGVSYNGFLEYAPHFDVVCMTYYKAVQYAKDVINDIGKKVRYGYYIQDFEPLFFKKDTREYRDALKSYTEKTDMVCVTKTTWNYNIVKRETSRECTVLGPSVNLDLFRPRKAFGNQKVIKISAMVRPSSPRRAPEMTMDVLSELKRRYQEHIEITIFGCDEREYSEFFKRVPTDFEYRSLGKVTPSQMAAVLSDSDIFADYSEFQAMGLTAMEAMASGCAVVLPVHGGTGDFAKNEQNCLVINTLDRKVCINETSRLIEDADLRYELAVQATKDMCRFVPEKCAFRFMEQMFK